MNKDHDKTNQTTPEVEQRTDVTVDIDAQTLPALNSQDSTDRNTPVGGNLTSIAISEIDQTMDLDSPSESIESGTIDLGRGNGQTMDVDSSTSGEFDGTRIVSSSMTPFQGKVFGDQNHSDAGGQTRILGPDSGTEDQTMEISEYSSGSSQIAASSVPDATMLLGDSQQGSNTGSSSIAGKSSYDQTMDLSESASESKSGSDAKSISGVNKTGQSVPATGRSNFKSVADSRQYLQAERAKASDAFLDRVTERKISYTIDWNDVSADYQVNKRIDPKTGKLDLHVLGKGGMGLVYLATQNSVNRSVALKVIRKDKQTEAFSKQFFYEAEITAQLEHPNITPIYELGRTPDGTFFYSMKYIQGTPWEKKIRENSIEENLDIFDKLCDAIAFAHSKNIVHMDIKPDNVQLGEFGEVYAVDWGVASNLKRPESIRCAGTWQWISPEVSRGERDKIGKGSDIYLLGGILFLIVTGHHPRLPKDPSEKMGQTGLTKAAQNNIIQPTDCKDPMVAVALRAMETDPKQRFARVEDLQEALYAIQKERANIKSSQELTERSIALGNEAQEHGDYDRFNRSLFGLKDAIELWQKNPTASDELKKVRLAYGQCAFEKGDYDLALQTLDRSERQEEDLYFKAEQAQTAVKLRAWRFTLLRNAFILSLIGLSAVIIYFFLVAQEQRWTAEANEALAETNAEAAQKNEKEALEQKSIAEENARIAKENAIEAGKQREKAEENAIEAGRQQRIAESNAAEARKQQAKAEEQLAKTQLTEITSRLGLARSRINEANPTGANDLLSGIGEQIRRWSSQWGELQARSTDKEATAASPNTLISKLPNPDNWATNRISLLANADLPGTDLQAKTNFKSGRSAFTIDPKDSSLLVANPSGEIYRVSFDGKDPVKIWEKDPASDWSDVRTVRRVVASGDQNRVYLALDRRKDPVIVVNLSDGSVTQFDKEIPGVGERIALSPISRHIATTQSGYIWFTRNVPNTLGNGVPTKDKAVQIQWLTDELLLALVENQGSYHLQLIAPFVDVDPTNQRPTFVQYTASLKEDTVQFALINDKLPDIIANFSPKSLKNLKVKVNGERESSQAKELFAEILESLHFVFGQGDGNLVQTRLKRPSSNPDEGNLWTLIEQFPLPRKHVHAIREILVDNQPLADASQRRIITRADSEQAVQVWDLSVRPSSTGQQDDAVIYHLHELSGRPLKDDTGQTGVVFAGFDKDGKVVLINSDLIAHRLDVQEQMDRKRIVLETPFAAATYQEPAAKWLFNSVGSDRVVSIDGYGAAAVYKPDSKDIAAIGKRLVFNVHSEELRIKQLADLGSLNPRGKINLVDSSQGFMYWGHSPFARIEDFAFSPDRKTAISLASIPGSKSVYHIPRTTDLLADDLKFREICLWDLENAQLLDRIVLTSEAGIDRLSALDNNRFVFGNTETLSVIERTSNSMISPEMAKSAVHFCVANPVYPLQAFFRADGAQGTCWIGNVSLEKAVSAAPQKWLSKDNNRMAMMDAAPATGCWSADGKRLYVLDKLGQIRKFDLDPNSGTLSATIGQDSLDLLKENPLGQDFSGILVSRPQQVFLRLAGSNSTPEGWRDELLIGSIPQLQESGDSEIFAKPIHAVFASSAAPTWKKAMEESDSQKEFLELADRLVRLAHSNKAPNNSPERTHEPLHATSDAAGHLVLLQYPTSILALKLNENNTSRWHRIDKPMKDLKNFSLSPDGGTLATVDDAGLHLFKVLKSQSDSTVSLEPLESNDPNAAAVKHFAWDPNTTALAPEEPNRFAYILNDNTLGYLHSGTLHNLGKLCEMNPSNDSRTDQTTSHEIQVSEVQNFWFFKETLTDQTQTPTLQTDVHYLSIQYRYEDSTSGHSTQRFRFIKLPDSDPKSLQASDRNCVDLDLGQTITKAVANEKGGIVVTGDDVGNVVVYLVSPHWGLANPIFDANSEADSAIEGLIFAENGNLLVVSNANNHLFGMPTKPVQSK